MTGSSTAAAIRATAPSMTCGGIRSPSSQPSDRAHAALDVAIARQPGTAATARALATSQTFASTSGSGPAWSSPERPREV